MGKFIYDAHSYCAHYDQAARVFDSLAWSFA